jgi:hypothetical protein
VPIKLGNGSPLFVSVEIKIRNLPRSIEQADSFPARVREFDVSDDLPGIRSFVSKCGNSEAGTQKNNCWVAEHGRLGHVSDRNTKFIRPQIGSSAMNEF